MNKYTKLIFVMCLSAPLVAIAQTTIFEHYFDGLSNVQLGGQTTDTGSVSWQNATLENTSSFRADGSVVNDSGSSGIWLPVTIEQGNIYTLSADVDTDSSVGTDWISLGYAENSADNAFFRSGGYGTAAVKPNRVDAFTGAGTSGKQSGLSGAGNGEQRLKIVLDATAADTSLWTMEFFENDLSFTSPVYAADTGNYANINFIGFSKVENATGTIDNFKFSVTPVPEITHYSLIAAVIASLVVCSRRHYRGHFK